MAETQILIDPSAGSSYPCNVFVDQGHRNPPYIYTRTVKNQIEEKVFIEECIDKIQAKSNISIAHLDGLIGPNNVYEKWLREEKGLNVHVWKKPWHRGDDAHPFLIKCSVELNKNRLW